jgi:hypothetical protein
MSPARRLSSRRCVRLRQASEPRRCPPRELPEPEPAPRREAVKDLAALLASANQAAAFEDQQVVGNGRPAERYPRGHVADVELVAGQQLDQVLAGRIGQRVEEFAAGHEVVAQLPHFGAEGIWRDQAADVLVADYFNRLNRINILGVSAEYVKLSKTPISWPRTPARRPSWRRWWW